jgi:hypothetical protein
VRCTCPPRAEISKRVRPFGKTLCNLSPAGRAEPCADEDVGALRAPVPRGRGCVNVFDRSAKRCATCPPRAGLNRVPTRTSVLSGHLSPAGGGESAVADLGVEFCRLDFEVGLAAHSVPSRRGVTRLGECAGTDFRNAGASLVYLCYAARRGRPLCLPFLNAATGAIRMGRHRGLPLHSGAQSHRGSPVHPGHATASGLPRYIQLTQPRRGCPVHPGYATASGLPRYIQLTQSRRGGPGTSRLRNRVEVAPVHPAHATASGLPRYVQVTQLRGGCPCNPEGNRGDWLTQRRNPADHFGFRGISGASAAKRTYSGGISL